MKAQATVDDFLTLFPEFVEIETSLLQGHLNGAWLSIAPDIWREKASEGHAYLAAHRIALSPMGQNARLVAKDGSTTYWTHFAELRRGLGIGGLVL